MDDLSDILFLLLLVAIVWWIFSSRKAVGDPLANKRPEPKVPPEKKTPPQRTTEEIEADRKREEWLREQNRLAEAERREHERAEKAAQDAEARRKSLEAATRRTEEENERRKRLAARNTADSTVKREFERFINQPIPPEIQRSMRAFLAGEFKGADQSPLAYVGYRVGKTNGLPAWDRKRRMEVCFRIDIPQKLRREYSSWGGPASRERLNSMCAHIRMLAAMRHDRPGYEVAVAEWEGDAEWLRSQMSDRADRYTRQGVTW